MDATDLYKLLEDKKEVDVLAIRELVFEKLQSVFEDHLNNIHEFHDEAIDELEQQIDKQEHQRQTEITELTQTHQETYDKLVEIFDEKTKFFLDTKKEFESDELVTTFIDKIAPDNTSDYV